MTEATAHTPQASHNIVERLSRRPEVVKMNFDEAIVAHAEWKLKLTLYLQGEGKLDPSVIRQDNQCKLGKWIYSDGRKYQNETAYEELRRLHADFHRCAACVVESVDQGNKAEAKQQIAPESEYSTVSAKVIDAIGVVKRRVEEKTNLIMASVASGVLVVDSTLIVQSGYSAFCHELLNAKQVAGRHLADLLGRSGNDFPQFEACMEQVFDDILPPEVSLAMLPSRVEVGDRVIGVQANAIRSSEAEIDYVLFTLTDATREATLERENQENLALIRVIRNREAFVDFANESLRSLAECEKHGDDQVTIRREVHTFKGNSGLFDLHAIASACGVVEDNAHIEPEHLRYLSGLLRSFVAKHTPVLGDILQAAPQQTHQISHRELSVFEQALLATDSDPRRVAGALIRRLHLRPVRSLLGPIEERVESLSHRLGKAVRCVVEEDTIAVDPERAAALFRAMAHVVRNSLDHGIESPDERETAGKPRQGTLSVTFASLESTLEITVRDDGRGIDGDRVAGKAIERGLVTKEQVQQMSWSQRAELVFLDGISTADSVTDVSGRGVGMSAFAEAVRTSGGTLRVETERGKGTTLRMTIPQATS